jgi:hypothetical protein
MTLEAAVTARADVVQLATWNDYGEGTMIEPTVQNGYRALETLQDLRRRLDPLFTSMAILYSAIWPWPRARSLESPVHDSCQGTRPWGRRHTTPFAARVFASDRN